jgi:hypothetical protein
MIEGKSYIHPEILLESYNFFVLINDKAFLSNMLSEHVIYNLLNSEDYIIECHDCRKIKNKKIRRVKVTNIKTKSIHYYIIDARNYHDVKIYKIIASYRKVFLKNNTQNIHYNSLSEYLNNYNWEIIYHGDLKDTITF